MAMATAFIYLLLAAPAFVYAVDYTVGDSNGWTSGVDYTNWVSGKSFKVGDTLIFNYGASHGLDEVTKSDYDSCSSSNAIDSHSDGNTRINLTATGSRYFICPTIGHCGNGMKLAVTVSAASSGGNTPTTGSSPTTTTTTTTPSPAHSAATTSSCNMMMLVISLLVGGAFMG